MPIFGDLFNKIANRKAPKPGQQRASFLSGFFGGRSRTSRGGVRTTLLTGPLGLVGGGANLAARKTLLG